MNEKTVLILNNTVQGSFAGIASAFIGQTLSHMIPWLMVTAAVILCDLAFGVRKSLIMGEEVRFSRAVRNTMGKMVTYFAFVCMVCMICVASGEQYGIDQWSCLLICFIEGCSIIGNILKPKGIDFNLLGAFREIGKATFRKVNMEVDTEKVFVEGKPRKRPVRRPKAEGGK
jgi:hypothetical protein